MTKLEKPTISYRAEGGVYLIDWDGQNNRLWLKGEYGLPIWSMDGRRVSVAGGVPDKFYGKYVLNLRTGRRGEHGQGGSSRQWASTSGANSKYLAAEWMPGGRADGLRRVGTGALNAASMTRTDELYMLTISTGKMVNITKTAGQIGGVAEPCLRTEKSRSLRT